MSNINISAFKKICRFCLSTSDLIFINDTNIIDVLHSLSDIKYSNTDELPQKLCTKCIKFMEEIQSFVSKCQQTHLNLTKCLTDFKNNQNTLLKNETINIVNVEDILNKTKIINGTNNINQPVTEEEVTLTNCLNKQKTLNNTNVIIDNIEENISSNISTDNSDEYANKFEIIDIKEEIEDNINNSELVTEHFKVEELIFHQMVAQDEIKNEEITNPKQHENNPELTNIEETQILTNKKSDKRSLQCHICNKIFKAKKNLKRHMITHSDVRPFKCDICLNKFKYSSNLAAHKKVHDNDERQRQCEVCNKTFAYKSALKQHMETHTDELRFECIVCLKRFKRSGHLILHERVHSGECRHQCEVCNKTFIKINNLEKHRATHIDQRRFE